MKIINNSIKRLAYEVSIYDAIQEVSEEIKRRYRISSVDAEEIADDAVALLITENEKHSLPYNMKYEKSNRLIEREVKKILEENIEKEELSEEIPEKSDFKTKSLEDAIEEVLSTIPEKEKVILKERFGFEGDAKTLKELSAMLNSSINIIRCYENRALRMLRHPSRSRELREYY